MVSRENDGDNFGYSVAVSADGRHLVVGSPRENDETGAIRIYEIVDGAFVLSAVSRGQAPSERAGWSVAVSGSFFILHVAHVICVTDNPDLL